MTISISFKWKMASNVGPHDMHVVHKNMVDGCSMVGFPLVIVDSELDIPGTKPGPLGWHTSTLTT